MAGAYEYDDGSPRYGERVKGKGASPDELVDVALQALDTAGVGYVLLRASDDADDAVRVQSNLEPETLPVVFKLTRKVLGRAIRRGEL